MKKYKKSLVCCLMLLVLSGSVLAGDVSEYLILNDIDGYKFTTEGRDIITGESIPIKGYTVRTAPGDLIAADHFYLKHDDITYETDYVNVNVRLAVEVQVTQHTGAEADKWLSHEIEDSFRDGDNEDGRLGLLSDGSRIRNIASNNILFYGWGVIAYRWLSNNVVINIEYKNFGEPKPEPLEIVRIYLEKFPKWVYWLRISTGF